MSSVHLPGLDGTNPLGFFAAVGACHCLEAAGRADAALTWGTGPIPSPTVHGVDGIDDLLEVLATELDAWTEAWILNGELADVKLASGEIRPFLSDARDAVDDRSLPLASALLAEGSLDRSGIAKPTDLHFTAGQQRWLNMAASICREVTVEDISRALQWEWSYRSKLPSLMWDSTDDRVYALSSVNPAKEKKLTEPGAEWLALMALPVFPAFFEDRTRTPGCSGRWKVGAFRWPLWRPPIGTRTITSLVGSPQMAESPVNDRALKNLGVSLVAESEIRRSDQGGYGTFGPAVAVWDDRIGER